MKNYKQGTPRSPRRPAQKQGQQSVRIDDKGRPFLVAFLVANLTAQPEGEGFFPHLPADSSTRVGVEIGMALTDPSSFVELVIRQAKMFALGSGKHYRKPEGVLPEFLDLVQEGNALHPHTAAFLAVWLENQVKYYGAGAVVRTYMGVEPAKAATLPAPADKLMAGSPEDLAAAMDRAA
jgi:hypothetical protein